MADPAIEAAARALSSIVLHGGSMRQIIERHTKFADEYSSRESVLDKDIAAYASIIIRAYLAAQPPSATKEQMEEQLP